MAMAYDITFGIWDQRNSTNPLDPVGYHPAEDYFRYSGVYRALDRFQHLEVHNRFGISLLDYLSLPHDYVTAINEICIDYYNNEQKIQKQLENQYEADKAKLSPAEQFQRLGSEDPSLWGKHQKKS